MFTWNFKHDWNKKIVSSQICQYKRQARLIFIQFFNRSKFELSVSKEYARFSNKILIYKMGSSQHKNTIQHHVSVK